MDYIEKDRCAILIGAMATLKGVIPAQAAFIYVTILPQALHRSS